MKAANSSLVEKKHYGGPQGQKMLDSGGWHGWPTPTSSWAELEARNSLS